MNCTTPSSIIYSWYYKMVVRRAAGVILLCVLVANFCHASRPQLRSGQLRKASSSPTNIDPKLDCGIKELAWDYAKKLLPWQGDFISAYDALQLGACPNVSRTPPYPSRPFSHSVAIRADVLTVYVDATKGATPTRARSLNQ